MARNLPHESKIKAIPADKHRQQRKWSAGVSREFKKFGSIYHTEESCSPEEGRAAINAALLETGHTLVAIHRYDANQDRFYVVAKSTATSTVSDAIVYGEVVAQIVKAARTIAGRAGRRLIRPGDLKPDGTEREDNTVH